MKAFLRVILSVLGYGIYTLAVLVVLLWFLFPVESFRGWLEAELDGQSETIKWKIEDLRIAWPLSFVALNIQAANEEGEESLVAIDELKVRPDVKALGELKNAWPFTYRAKMLGGTISGDALLDKEFDSLNCSGQVSKVQVGGLEYFWKQMGRNVKGRLAGSFDYDGTWPVSFSSTVQADLAVKNGSIELVQPVFGLNTLEFTQLSTQVSIKDRTATFEKGDVDSNLFGVEFSGTMSLADNFLGSGLDITGSFEPRPELLGGLKGSAAVQLIRGQLKDSKLTFTLTDTVLEPGVLFQGVSGVIDGVIQGSSR